jgi:hypothetical protein
MALNQSAGMSVCLLMKRVLILLMLVFYTASAFAAVPWLPARAMHHDGGAAAAVVTEHHDCDEANAAAVAATAVDHDENCSDCTLGFSPCCTGMFALTTGSDFLSPPLAVADRTPHSTTLQLASRGDSIYRPPRG